MFKCERGDAPPFCRRDEKKRVLRTDLGGVGGWRRLPETFAASNALAPPDNGRVSFRESASSVGVPRRDDASDRFAIWKGNKRIGVAVGGDRDGSRERFSDAFALAVARIESQTMFAGG